MTDPTDTVREKKIIVAKKYGPGMAQRMAKAWIKLKEEEEKAMKEFEEKFGFVADTTKDK